MWSLYYFSCCEFNNGVRKYINTFNNELDAINYLISLVGEIQKIYEMDTIDLNNNYKKDDESDLEEEIYKIFIPINDITKGKCNEIFGRVIQCIDHKFPKPFFIIDKDYHNNYQERIEELYISLDCANLYDYTY